MGQSVGTHGTSARNLLSLYVQCDTVVGGGLDFEPHEHLIPLYMGFFFYLLLCNILNIYRREWYNEPPRTYTQLQQLSTHSQTSFIDTSHFPLLGWVLWVVLPALLETMLSLARPQ